MERSKITVNIQEGSFVDLPEMETGVFGVARRLRDRIELAVVDEPNIKLKVIIVTCQIRNYVGSRSSVELTYEVVLSFWTVEKKFQQGFYADAHPITERDSKLSDFDSQLGFLVHLVANHMIHESTERNRQGSAILLCAHALDQRS